MYGLVLPFGQKLLEGKRNEISLFWESGGGYAFNLLLFSIHETGSLTISLWDEGKWNFGNGLKIS